MWYTIRSLKEGGREMGTQSLKQELELFEAQKSELLRTAKGKYVLIHENKIIDTFSKKEDALKKGYETYGNKPFLVKLISDSPKRLYFMSNVVSGSCCELAS
jgi:hypothetical protein